MALNSRCPNMSYSLNGAQFRRDRFHKDFSADLLLHHAGSLRGILATVQDPLPMHRISGPKLQALNRSRLKCYLPHPSLGPPSPPPDAAGIFWTRLTTIQSQIPRLQEPLNRSHARAHRHKAAPIAATYYPSEALQENLIMSAEFSNNRLHASPTYSLRLSAFLGHQLRS